jgi:hypothetical protein
MENQEKAGDILWLQAMESLVVLRKINLKSVSCSTRQTVF